MLAKGLAFNTITGYRTAISEIHDPIDGVKIGSHQDISKILKAIHIEHPPPVQSDDPINIISSLKYIKSLGDNDNMSLRDLSIKMAFLLALVTGSHPSDLKKINLITMTKTRSGFTFNCMYLKKYKIARSHSLSIRKSPTK